MHEELIHFTDIISILEIAVTLPIALIGVISHEIVYTQNYSGLGSLKKLLTSTHVWVTVFVSFIISYSIDPYIVKINPRLVMLPPLILGLLGNELIIRLSTIKGSTSFIAYIVQFIKYIFGKDSKPDPISDTPTNNKPANTEAVVNNESVSNTTSDDNSTTQEAIVNNNESTTNNQQHQIVNQSQTENNEPQEPLDIISKKDDNNRSMSDDIKRQLLKLDTKVHYVLNDMDNILLDFYNDINECEEDNEENIETFKKSYQVIKPKINSLLKEINEYEYLPVSTSIKFAEILRKELDLDKIYRTTVQLPSVDISEANVTSE